MKHPDRRVRRTQKSLHEALIALALERNYDSITVQEVLDRADVGRSTFYAHFHGKDELLMSGFDNLRQTLSSAIQQERATAMQHENLLGFSRAMFEHVSEFRPAYYALANTTVFPLVRQRMLEMLNELIDKECRSELMRLRKSNPKIPIELFVSYLSTTFFTVLTWWLDRRQRLSVAELDRAFRSLALPTVQSAFG